MNPEDLDEALDHYYKELFRIQSELNRAAMRRAQYLYMGGALLGLGGFFPLAALCALVAWLLQHSVFHQPVAFAFGCAIAGALGAAASVSWRASIGRLDVDPAAGIGALSRLGMLRPPVGAIFGLALYFALRSDLLNIGQSSTSFYLFGFLSFVAGFSERVLPDLVRRAEGHLVDAHSSEPLGPSERPGDAP